eukprot:8003289-Alexandrium_andersonii.AAC.1
MAASSTMARATPCSRKKRTSPAAGRLRREKGRAVAGTPGEPRPASGTTPCRPCPQTAGRRCKHLWKDTRRLGKPSLARARPHKAARDGS